jgi:transposase InsO family protein
MIYQEVRVLSKLKECKSPFQRRRTIHSRNYVGVRSRVSIPSEVLSEISYDHGIIQSISLKGNPLDNSTTKTFFGRLKKEIYYDLEYRFKPLEELKETINQSIDNHNIELIVNR